MKKDELPTIGERIAFVRGELTQAEFALKLGANRMTVGRYERGEREPNSSFLCLLIEKFGVDANWLLLGTGDIPKPPPQAEVITQKNNEPCIKCARLEAELFEERAENREQAKELREMAKENRELVRENRDLGKENMKLVRQLAGQGSPDLMPRNAKPAKGSSAYSPAHCRLPEDDRNKDKYEERQE